MQKNKKKTPKKIKYFHIDQIWSWNGIPILSPTPTNTCPSTENKQKQNTKEN